MPSNADRLLAAREELKRVDDELDEMNARNGEDMDTWPQGQIMRAENLLRARDRTADAVLMLEAERAEQLGLIRDAQRSGLTETIAQPAHPVARQSPGDEVRNRAARALEGAHRAGHVTDDGAAVVENLLQLPGQQSINMAEWVARSASTDYYTAFAKRLADPLNGHLLWTGDEADAFRSVAEYAQRAAMSTTNSTGILPLALDPAWQLTNSGSEGGIRSVARTETIAAASWNGLTSAGATAEVKTEGAEAADGTPSVSAVNIPLYTVDVDAVVSYELLQDGVHLPQELARVMYDAASVKVDGLLATGSGSGAPTGIITAITGSTDQVLTAGTFASANVVSLQNKVPPRYQKNAKFVMPLAVRNAVNSFETTNGALRFPETANGRLLNRDLVEDSNISADMTTSGSKFAVYGDWSQFVFLTHAGSSLEMLPTYGSNGRPTAQRSLFLFMRVGANVLASNAFAYLQKS